MPQDPRNAGPKPPYPAQKQDPPGLETEMSPNANPAGSRSN